MASNDVVVNVKFNFEFEGDVPPAASPSGAAFRAAFFKALDQPSGLLRRGNLGVEAPPVACGPSYDVEPLAVTDDEARWAGVAMCAWQAAATALDASFGAKMAAQSFDMGAEHNEKLADWIKRSLAEGRLLEPPIDGPKPEAGREAEAATCRAMALSVARCAVLTRRAVWGAGAGCMSVKG